MKYLALLTFLLLQTALVAQLNCKTKTLSGKKISTCYHKNGKISTLEEWDQEKRSGNIKAYNAAGDELFVYYLRTFAGHASVEITYHANGQVNRVNYSSAPDGGIQFFRARRSYDDKGALIDHWEEDYPPVPLTEPLHFKTPPQKIIPAEPVTNTCATPYTSLYMVTNVSGKSVELLLETKPNLWLSRSSKHIKLKPGQKAPLDSIVYAEKFFAPEMIYQIAIKHSKKHNNLNIIHAIPHTLGNKQVYMLYIIRE